MKPEHPSAMLPSETEPEAADELNHLRDRCRRLEAALEQFHARNRILGESAPFGIFTIDGEGLITGMNSRMQKLFPLSSDHDLSDLNAFKLETFVEAGVSDDLRNCLKYSKSIVKAHPCVDLEGVCRELRYHMSPIVNNDGNAEGAMVFVEDFSLMKQAAEAVRESDRRYRLLFHSAPVAMIERDASDLKHHLEKMRTDGINDFETYFDENPQEVLRCIRLVRTIDFNKAFMDLLEADSRQELAALLPWDQSREFYDMARQAVLTVAGGIIGQEHERIIQTLKGNRKTVLARALAVSGHEDTLSHLVITLIDISKRKEAEEALRANEQKFRAMALRDTLTGLFNRRYLYKTLPELIGSGRFDQNGISLIFLDLDNFKRVVDAHGHLNGSQVIREVAATIRMTIEDPAFAVAYAGDEFVVVLPDTQSQHAFGKAVEIQESIKNTDYLQSVGLKVQIKASFGVAHYPEHARDRDELLALADHALFTVKTSGKDGVAVHAAG